MLQADSGKIEIKNGKLVKAPIAERKINKTKPASWLKPLVIILTFCLASNNYLVAYSNYTT